MHYDDFVLQLDASARGGFRARVVKSPFGEGAVAFTLPAVAGISPGGGDPASAVSRDVEHAAGSAQTAAELPPIEIGTEIYRAVFQGQVRSLLDKSRGHLEMSADRGLRLKIKLDPGDPDTAALADLPWELLCDGDTEDFFALSRQTSLVRYLDVPRSSQPIAFTPPLRILAVSASPRSLPPLDLAEETRRLEALHRQAGSGIEVRHIVNASAGAVREALAGDEWNVLHFMGHGTFDRTSGEGMLAFEGAEGRLDLVSGRAFATKLRDLRSMGVVVLNACNTARAGRQEGGSPFRGVATALVLGGVPAVVAMQRPISDRAAIGFSTSFYRHLARGDSIDEALTEGRQAIHSAEPEGCEWATPVLFLRILEGNVFVAKPPDAPPAPARDHAPAPTASQAVPPAAAAAQATSVPAPGGRSAMLKTAAGVAGAGLIAVGVYFVRPRAAAPPELAHRQALGTSHAAGPPPRPDPGAEPHAMVLPRGGQGSSGKTTAGTGSPSRVGSELGPAHPGQASAGASRIGTGSPSRSQVGTETPLGTGSSTTPQAGAGSSSAPPPTGLAPTPAKVEPAPPPPAVAPPADLSNLSAQTVSIARRDGGGLRVTVSFRNGGGTPLSVILDKRSAELSDNQGQRYMVLRSSLPVSGVNPRLDLPAGGTATVQFDFPAFKLGSKKFYLALATDDDRAISIAGSALTLENPP
jgi:CHAT domain